MGGWHSHSPDSCVRREVMGGWHSQVGRFRVRPGRQQSQAVQSFSC